MSYVEDFKNVIDDLDNSELLVTSDNVQTAYMGLIALHLAQIADTLIEIKEAKE